MNKQELHSRLKEARRELNLNQIEIARDLEIQQKSISEIENGKILNIPNTYIYYFFKKGISLEWLYDGKGNMLIDDKKTEKSTRENPHQLELLLDKLTETPAKTKLIKETDSKPAKTEPAELYERLIDSKDLNINSLLAFIKSQENNLEFMKDLINKLMK